MAAFEPDRLDFVFSSMHEGVLVEDENRTVKFTNAAFTAIFAPGVLPEQMYGADCDAAAVMSAPLFDNSDAWLAHTRALVAAKRPVTHDEWRMADGRWLDRDYFPRLLDGQVIEHMWVYRDVTDKHEREAAIERLAERTTRSDFRGWEEATSRLTHDFPPMPGGRNMSVVLVKLLVLERINTELGHDAGDEVLSAVLADLREQFGVANVERVRGATFAVLVEDEQPEQVFGTIHAKLDLSRQTGEQVFLLRYVLGASSGPAASSDELNSLVAAAFIALNEAARTRADVVSDPELLARMRVRFDIEARLQPALAGGEFELFYQPIQQLDTREVVGAEALLRWRHPLRGMLSAGDFVPHIESLGLMPFVDLWVIEQVCADLAAMVGKRPIRIGFNLSPLTLSSGHDIVAALTTAVEMRGIDRQQLVIEVTESAIGADPDRTVGLMRELQALGFSIAIDDFGVGTSTLGLLKDVSFDFLKLDKSFTQDLDDPRVKALITAVCSMTRALGGSVIAEGVESERGVDLLMTCGVTTGQGWLFGHPEPMNRFGSPG
jgi:EAL domain-containing protein (putative c-di-GMP-specific phosphodiesterase class I)/GGDEF domain-containing protein